MHIIGQLFDVTRAVKYTRVVKGLQGCECIGIVMRHCYMAEKCTNVVIRQDYRAVKYNSVDKAVKCLSVVIKA